MLADEVQLTLAISNNPQELDYTIRKRLSESLEYVFTQSRDLLVISPSDQVLITEQINAHQVNPGLFARYYDLVFSIQNKNFDYSQKLINQIIELSKQHSMFEVIPYSEQSLEDDYERFPRLAFSTFSQDCPMSTPDRSLFEMKKSELIQAQKIIASIDRGITKEINQLITQIIICVKNEEAESVREFAGVTSLMLWGAIIVNVNQYQTLNQLVDFLIHESTHCVLFGISVSNPLVLNDIQDRYPSPLRSDPRPMDGIYHATIVCARLALFMNKWKNSTIHSASQTNWLDGQITANTKAFKDGLVTLNEHGKLSKQGSDIVKRFEKLIENI